PQLQPSLGHAEISVHLGIESREPCLALLQNGAHSLRRRAPGLDFDVDHAHQRLRVSHRIGYRLPLLRMLYFANCLRLRRLASIRGTFARTIVSGLVKSA